MNLKYKEVLHQYPWKFSAGSVTHAIESGILDVSGFHQYADYSNKNDEMRELLVYDPYIVVNLFQQKKFRAFIVASTKSQKFLTVSVKAKEKWTTLNLSKTQFTIVDLNDNGDRWEGESLGTLPCGWGVYYSSSNTVTYVGFRFWSWDVCYGTYYFEDMQTTQPYYQGMLCFNKQFGEGKLYSRMGPIIKTTETINALDIQSLDVIVPPDTSDRIYYNNLMRSFTVQQDSYVNVHHISFVNFPNLKTVVIMNNSYSSAKGGFMKIENCPELQSIKIGEKSFLGYYSFLIRNCPKLETLEVDKQSFESCRYFFLEGIHFVLFSPQILPLLRLCTYALKHSASCIN